MKRSVFLLIILILAVAAGFLYFFFFFITFSNDTSIYKAVPVSAPFFLEFKSLKSIPFENPALNQFEQAGIWSHFFDITKNLDSLIINNEEINNKMMKTSRTIAEIIITGFIV